MLKIIAPIHYFYDHHRDRLPETIELEKNLVLTRFDRQVIAPVIDFFTDLYSGHDVKDLENCRYCVVYDFEPTEKETREQAQAKIHHVIETLRVVRPTQAACSTFIFSTDKDGKLQAEGASQKSSTIFLTYGEQVGSSHFKTGEEKKIKQYYSYVSKLYELYGGSYNRVLNAFIFFQLGYLTHYAKLRVVPFIIALESLFNTSEQEVGYSLRIRCASFLGKDKVDKEDIIKKLKKIYELRSSAVHGASLPRGVVRNPLQANDIIRDAEDICRRCLQKIFNEDLDDFFSKSSDKLSQSLDELVIA